MIIFNFTLDIRCLLIFIFYFYASCENPEKLGENLINDPTEIGDEDFISDDDINLAISNEMKEQIISANKLNNNIVQSDSPILNDLKNEILPNQINPIDKNNMNTFINNDDKLNNNLKWHEHQLFIDSINSEEINYKKLNDKAQDVTTSQDSPLNSEGNNIEKSNKNYYQSIESNDTNYFNILENDIKIANDEIMKNDEMIYENKPEILDKFNNDIITNRNKDINTEKNTYDDLHIKNENQKDNKKVLTKNNEPLNIHSMDINNKKKENNEELRFEEIPNIMKEREIKTDSNENEISNNLAIKQNIQNDKNIEQNQDVTHNIVEEYSMDKVVLSTKNNIYTNKLIVSKIEELNNPEMKINNLNDLNDFEEKEINVNNNQIDLNDKFLGNNDEEKLLKQLINEDKKNNKNTKENNFINDQLEYSAKTEYEEVNPMNSIMDTNIENQNDLTANIFEHPFDKISDISKKEKLTSLDSDNDVSLSPDTDNSEGFQIKKHVEEVVKDNEAYNWLLIIWNFFTGIKDTLIMSISPWIIFVIDQLPASLQGLFYNFSANIHPSSAVIIFILIILIIFISSFKIIDHTRKREKDYLRYVENIELTSNLQRELLLFRQETEELEKRKSELEGTSKSSLEENIKLNEKLQQTEYSLEKMESTFNDQHNQIEELNKQLKVQTNLVNEHIKKNKAIQGKLDKATKQSASAETKLQQSEISLKAFESQCRDLQQQILEQTERINQFENANEKILNDTRSQQKSIEDLVETKSELQSELMFLKKSLEEKEFYIKNLETGIKEMKIFEKQLYNLSNDEMMDAIDGDNPLQKEQQITQCLKSLLEVTQFRAEFNSTNEKNKLLEKEISDEFENRKQLQDTIKELKMKEEKLRADLNEAEEKVKSTNVKMEVLHNYFKEKEIDLTRELGEHIIKEKYVTDDLLNKDDLVKNMQQSIADLKLRESDLQNELRVSTANHNKQISQFEKVIHDYRMDLAKATRELSDFKHTNIHLNSLLIDAQNKLKAEAANSLPSNSTAISPPLILGEERPPSIPYPINQPPIPNLRLPFNPQLIDRGFPIGIVPQIRPMLRFPHDVQWRNMNPLMHNNSPKSFKNGRHSSDYVQKPLRNDYSPVHSRGSHRRRGSTSPYRSMSDDSRDSSPHSPRRRSLDSPRSRSPDSPRGRYSGSPRRRSYSSRSRSPESPRNRSPRNRSPDYSRRSNSLRKSSYSSREKSPDNRRSSKYKKRQRSKSLNSAYKNKSAPVDKISPDKSSPVSRQTFESPPTLQESFDHDSLPAPVARRGERRNV